MIDKEKGILYVTSQEYALLKNAGLIIKEDELSAIKRRVEKRLNGRRHNGNN